MNRLLLLLLTFFCCSVFVFSQAPKHDQLWLLGAFSNPNDTTFGGTIIDFSKAPPLMSYEYREMNIDMANSSMCDKNGELLFYTNGAYVANAVGDTMLNGAPLNEDSLTYFFMDNGLPVIQGIISLPIPGENEDDFILIHAEVIQANDTIDSLFTAFLTPKLFYSTIDMSLDGGLGGISSKNNLILQDTLDLGKIVATRHANGKDWWIVLSEINRTNFYTFLLSEEGIAIHEKQDFGYFSKFGTGNASFSLDGTRYARISSDFPALGSYFDVLDFDRCTGEITNVQNFNLEHNYFGCQFSPDGKLLYLINALYIVQLDMESDNLMESADTVAFYDGFADPFPTWFFFAQLGVDEKIYINVRGINSRWMHIIHEPNVRGPGCMVEQHGIQLPTHNSFSLPNLPNYRLGPLPGSPCDTIVSATNNIAVNLDDRIKLSPNPACNMINIAFESMQEYSISHLEIIDNLGRVKNQLFFSQNQSTINLDINHLEAGVYFVRFFEKEFGVISTKQMVVIE